jgi:azurin
MEGEMNKPNELLRNLLLLSLITFLLGFMAACGGGETEEETAEPESQPSQAETMADDIRTIQIIGIDDMKFAVEEEMEGITVGQRVGMEGNLLLLETIEAQPGEQIRIRLTTRSQLPPIAMSHNWVLMVPDANATDFVNQALQAREQDYIPPALTSQVLYHTEMVGGGETTEIVFTAPENPGEYEYLCSFPGHYAAGMKGFLVVSDGAEEMELE